MDEKTAFIHHFLNDLHEKAQRIQAQLKAKGTAAKLLYKRERHILVDGVYRCQNYPIPSLRVDPNTEIGVNLNGTYFDFWCEKEACDIRQVLAGLAGSFQRVEAYGPCDWKDFFVSGQDLDEAVLAIGESSDSCVAFVVHLSHDIPNVVELFFKARAIVEAGQKCGEAEGLRKSS